MAEGDVGVAVEPAALGPSAEAAGIRPSVEAAELRPGAAVAELDAELGATVGALERRSAAEGAGRGGRGRPSLERELARMALLHRREATRRRRERRRRAVTVVLARG